VESVIYLVFSNVQHFYQRHHYVMQSSLRHAIITTSCNHHYVMQSSLRHAIITTSCNHHYVMQSSLRHAIITTSCNHACSVNSTALMFESPFALMMKAWASEGGGRGLLTPMEFENFSKKGSFLSFEWEKTNFTTFCPPTKILKNPLVAPPMGEIFPAQMDENLL